MRFGRAIGLGVICAGSAAAVALAAPAGTPKGRLVIDRPVLGPAQPLSSKRFTLTFPVRWRGTRKPLSAAAAVVARPAIGRQALPYTASFRRGKARVSLLVPPDAMDKVLKMKAIVTTRGGSANRTATFGIRRGQPLPTITVADASAPESPVRTGVEARHVVFEVKLSAPDYREVSVAYTTHDGTAVAPGDYDASSGRLVIFPHENERWIDVFVRCDSEVEPDETFTVELSDPENATIADGEATGTITQPPGRTGSEPCG